MCFRAAAADPRVVFCSGRLIGEVRLSPEGTSLMAEFELEGGRLLAAAEMKISVVAAGRFELYSAYPIQVPAVPACVIATE